VIFRYSSFQLNLDLSSFQDSFMTVSEPSDAAFSILSYFNFVDIKVALEEENTIRASPNVTLTGFIDAKVRIAPFTAGILSESDRSLANVSVDAISFEGELAQSLTPGIALSLSDDVEAADDVGSLLRKMVYNSKSLLGIGNIVFQGDAEEYAAMNRLFQIVRIQIPLQKIIWKGDGPSILIGPAPGNAPGAQSASIPSIDLSLIDGSLSLTDQSSVAASLKWELASTLPFELILPYVALRLGLNEIDAVKLSVEGLALKKGDRELNTDVDLAFGDDPLLPSLVVEVVDVFSGGLSASLLVVQGLRFGPSEDSCYGLFDRINLGVPLALIPSLLKMGSDDSSVASSGGGSFFKLNLPPSLSSFNFASLEPLIRSVDLATIPNASLQLESILAFTNILPFSLDAPFLRVILLAKNSPLVDITIQGLIAEGGVNNRKLSITAKFYNDATAVGAVSDIVSGRSVELELSSFVFGFSPENSIDVLSGLSLNIGEGGGDTGAGISLSSLAPWLKDLSTDSFNPLLKTVDLSVEGDGIRFGLDASITNPLPVTLKIGYISLAASLSGTSLARIDVSQLNVVRGEQEVTKDLDLKLIRDEVLKDKVKDLVDKILNGGDGDIVDLVGIVGGFSADDRIETFRSIPLSLTIPKLGGGGDGGVGLFDGISLASLSNLDLATTDVGLNFGLGGSLINTSPIAVNVGYLALNLNLAEAGMLAHLELSLTALRGVNDLVLTVKSTVGRDKRLAPVVKSVYDDFVAKRRCTALSIDSIMVGSRESTAFEHFSEISFEFPLSFDKTSDDSSNSTSSTSIIPSIKGLDLESSESGFDSKVDIEWAGFSFSVDVEVGHLAADLFINNSTLGTASTSMLKLNGTGSRSLDIPVAISFDAADSNASTEIAAIVNPIFSGDNAPAVVARFGGITFGSNSQNLFDLLSLVEFSFDFNLTSTTPTSSGSNSSFKLNSLGLALLDEGIGAAVGASFRGFGIPITARLGHLSLVVDLFERRLASISIANALLFANEGNQNLLIPLLASLANDDPVLSDKIASIANPILSGRPSPVESVEVSFKGVLFGNSSAKTFSLLEKVRADFVISLANMTGGEGSLFKLNAVDVEPVSVGLKAVLTANIASLNLPILQVNIPYLSVSVILKHLDKSYTIATLGSSDLLALGSGSNDLKIPILIDFTTYELGAKEAVKDIASTFLDRNPKHIIPLNETSEINIGISLSLII
jgi:hypothetical protein